MGRKELEAHIRKKGDEELEKISAEADAEIAKIRSETSDEAGKMAAEIKKRGEREAFTIEMKIIADAKLKARANVEKEKALLIDEAFTRAKDRILALPDAKKAEILKRLAREASVGIKEPIVYVDRKYLPLLPGASEKAINDFGVMVESKDKKASVDATLSAKLGSMKTDITPGVASVLFGGGDGSKR